MYNEAFGGDLNSVSDEKVCSEVWTVEPDNKERPETHESRLSFIIQVGVIQVLPYTVLDFFPVFISGSRTSCSRSFIGKSEQLVFPKNRSGSSNNGACVAGFKRQFGDDIGVKTVYSRINYFKLHYNLNKLRLIWAKLIRGENN
jgi:hypothetical protein